MNEMIMSTASTDALRHEKESLKEIKIDIYAYNEDNDRCR